MRWIWTTLFALVVLSGCPAPEGDGTARTTTTGDGTATARAEPAPAPALEGDPDSAGPAVTIWADPLLETLLAGLEHEFRGQWPGGYDVEYLELPELKARLESGKDFALPGVFLYPGRDNLRYLVDAGVGHETTARMFAGDRLAMIQQTGAGYQTASLFDTYTLRFDAFAVADPATSAGFFTDQALITDALKPRITDQLVTYPGAATVLEAVAADARTLGIVPVSSLAAAKGVEVVMLIGEDLHEDIQYRAIASSDDMAGALELLMFLSEDGDTQTRIPGYGFQDRETAFVED